MAIERCNRNIHAKRNIPLKSTAWQNFVENRQNAVQKPIQKCAEETHGNANMRSQTAWQLRRNELYTVY
jgi:hypothetical protein